MNGLGAFLRRKPLAGMMFAPEPAPAKAGDGPTLEWVPGQHWDPIVILDDAASEHYSMFFVEQEGTASSFRAMVEVIKGCGLPSILYSDRGSHYWHTGQAGGRPRAPNSVRAGHAPARGGDDSRVVPRGAGGGANGCSPSIGSACRRSSRRQASTPWRR